MSPPLILIHVRVLHTNSSAAEDIIVSTVVEAPPEVQETVLFKQLFITVSLLTVHSSNRPVTGQIGYLISGILTHCSVC